MSVLNSSKKHCVLITLTKKDTLHLRKTNIAHEYRRITYVDFKLRKAPPEQNER